MITSSYFSPLPNSTGASVKSRPCASIDLTAHPEGSPPMPMRFAPMTADNVKDQSGLMRPLSGPAELLAGPSRITGRGITRNCVAACGGAAFWSNTRRPDIVPPVLVVSTTPSRSVVPTFSVIDADSAGASPVAGTRGLSVYSPGATLRKVNVPSAATFALSIDHIDMNPEGLRSDCPRLTV